MADRMWSVRGVWKADGQDGEMRVTAPTQRAAETIASDRGLMVEEAVPEALAAEVVTHASPAPLPYQSSAVPPSLTYQGPPPAPPQPWYGKPMRVEQTGKEWKTIILVSTLAFIGGFVMLCAGAGSSSPSNPSPTTSVLFLLGVLMIIGGFIGLIVGRFGAWWNHG